MGLSKKPPCVQQFLHESREHRKWPVGKDSKCHTCKFTNLAGLYKIEGKCVIYHHCP